MCQAYSFKPEGLSVDLDPIDLTFCCPWLVADGLLSPADAYRAPHSPFYQLPPSTQPHSPSPLLVAPTPPALQKLLGGS